MSSGDETPRPHVVGGDRVSWICPDCVDLECRGECRHHQRTHTVTARAAYTADAAHADAAHADATHLEDS